MSSENTEGRVFGAVEYTEEDAVQDWRAIGREELLKQAIVALDGAKMEAEEAGDESYVRHVDAVLFPFLKTELKKATGEADSWMTPKERALAMGVLERLQGERLWEEQMTYLTKEEGLDEETALAQLIWDAAAQAEEAPRRGRGRS
jgi:hypothetical protein